MQSYPHPTEKGVTVTTPIFINTDGSNNFDKMLKCEHEWPPGKQGNNAWPQETTPDGMVVLGQTCKLCGAQRCIYFKLKSTFEEAT